MERRAYYRGKTLPWLLIAPQLLLVLVFFYWPTSQALYWAFTLEQAWGGGNSWVWFDNFMLLFMDARYWGTVLRSGFSGSWPRSRCLRRQWCPYARSMPRP